MADIHKEVQSRMKDERNIEAERLASEIFSSKGYNVYTPYERKYADSLSDIKKSSDAGDIVILNKGRVMVLEVKRLSDSNKYKNFTKAEDFKEGLFIIDSVVTYDKKSIKPTAYITFNSKMTHFGYFQASQTNPKDWGKKSIKVVQGEIDFYTVDISLIEFKEVKELLPEIEEQGSLF